MPTRLADLAGTWRKVTATPCSDRYPDHLRLDTTGRYVGTNDDVGKFAIWDSGTVEIRDAQTIRLSIANDAIVAYDFSLGGEVLMFVDPDGCEFSYRRHR
jgi:hypothetical protein